MFAIIKTAITLINYEVMVMPHLSRLSLENIGCDFFFNVAYRTFDDEEQQDAQYVELDGKTSPLSTRQVTTS